MDNKRTTNFLWSNIQYWILLLHCSFQDGWREHYRKSESGRTPSLFDSGQLTTSTTTKKNIYCWCFKLHWLWRKYCALATNDIFPKTSKKAEIVTSSVIKAWQIQKDHFTTFEIMWLYLGKLKHSVGFSILTKTLIHTHAHALIHTLIRFDWVYLNRKRPLYNVLESQKNFY